MKIRGLIYAVHNFLPDKHPGMFHSPSARMPFRKVALIRARTPAGIDSVRGKRSKCVGNKTADRSGGRLYREEEIARALPQRVVMPEIKT